MKQERVNKILEVLAERGIPQLVIADPAAIFYLTGKWIQPGERMLVLYLSVKGNHKLFINELFPVYDDLGVDKVWFNDTQDAVAILSQYINKESPVGIDKNWPAHFLLRLMEQAGGSRFVNGSVILDQVRMCKDGQERALMRDASRVNDVAMGQLVRLIPGGYSEQRLAQRLTVIYDELGVGCSFAPIIAYGANATDPHHEPDASMLQEGESVILDIGCKMNGYCADMTRTVFYKYAPDFAKKIYDIVFEANKRAIDMVKPGVRFCDIDAAARNHIEAAGYGKYFTHRTGHSIGLEVHEFGDVSSVNTAQVEPGMTFSIEPGIYLPGEVGVRVEDLVLVTEHGCEILNSFEKNLTIVG
ncbi:M24 family metallopeptidase [Sporomusa acidovorans]|uniref:Peptidase n=1 Tax=Sporomusa acidovorans (strain ATCC 49682 / DSM 3132 / Mol) TaxID=1123286 RepID=A0ABZ3JAE1_SPOA4|nr:Xaa-Pro peptidase family protein [Sporomusa acidovorans]OZC13337.1 putative peptidase [Sporomusa acidovorans DSM 3132]SDD95986.1 Xaa-Pro dipeptidase [Sporomusa acidovorans]